MSGWANSELCDGTSLPQSEHGKKGFARLELYQHYPPKIVPAMSLKTHALEIARSSLAWDAWDVWDAWSMPAELTAHKGNRQLGTGQRHERLLGKSSFHLAEPSRQGVCLAKNLAMECPRVPSEETPHSRKKKKRL